MMNQLRFWKHSVTGEDDNAVYYNMGYTYKLMGNNEEGAKCFQRVIDENPNDVLAYNHLGSIQAARGEHAKALNTYAKALQLDKIIPSCIIMLQNPILPWETFQVRKLRMKMHFARILVGLMRWMRMQDYW